MSLADEVAAAHAGEPNPAALVGEFRRTPVLIPLVNDSLMSAELSGICWLYAFSDEQELARFAVSRGAAPETELSYARAVGARLLDVVIPAIEGPAGVVLDAGSEQGMVFPPVSGIVPDSAAIDLTEPGQADSGPGAPVAGVRHDVRRGLRARSDGPEAGQAWASRPAGRGRLGRSPSTFLASMTRQGQRTEIAPTPTGFLLSEAGDLKLK